MICEFSWRKENEISEADILDYVLQGTLKNIKSKFALPTSEKRRMKGKGPTFGENHSPYCRDHEIPIHSQFTCIVFSCCNTPPSSSNPVRPA
jgi:hypothetical protein